MTTYGPILPIILGQDGLLFFCCAMKASWQGASKFSFPGMTFIIYLLFVVQTCFQELKQLECSFLLKFNPSVWEPSIYQAEFGKIQKLVRKKK